MDKWVSVSIAASVIWLFLLYIVSDQGLGLLSGFDFRWDRMRSDDSIIPTLAGWAAIWVSAAMFLKDWSEPVDFGALALRILKIIGVWVFFGIIYIFFFEFFVNLSVKAVGMTIKNIIWIFGAVISVYTVLVGYRLTRQIWREEKISIEYLFRG